MTAPALTFTPAPAVRMGDLVLETTYFTNPRTKTGLDKDAIGELAASIKDHGIEDPLKVIACRCPEARGGDTGTFLLVVDGQRRYRAAQLLGWKPDHEIPVSYADDSVIHLTGKTGAYWRLYALRTSSTRKELSSYELAEAAALARAGGETNEAIGGAIGKSSTWVSRFLTAKAKAGPDLEFAWKQGQITDEQVKDLAAVPEAKQAEAVKQITQIRAAGDRPAKAAARSEAKAAAASSAPPSKKVDPAASYTAPAIKILHELVALRQEHKPKDAYAKGVTDGVAFALGAVTAKDLARPFQWWLELASKAKLKKLAKGAARPKAKARTTKAKKPTKTKRARR